MPLSTSVPTLLDFAKRLDPDGKIATVVETLEQTNPILADMAWMEGNQTAGHVTTVRTGLPSVYWRLLNQGVQPSKSTTAQITEGIGMMTAYSEVDVKLANLNGNAAEWRFSESKPTAEAMNQEMAQTLFYGNSGTAPEEFNGLSMRYSSTTAGNARNLVLAGGSDTDNTSIWLVGWGENTIHGIFPKGSKAGLEHRDLGEVTVENTGGVSGARSQVYRDLWQWDAGIALRDWRYVVRIANIDYSVLVANSSPPDLTFYMTKAYHRLQSTMGCRPVWYMNRTVFEFLDIQRQTAVKAGGQLSYTVVDGKEVPSFRGIPIRVCDQLLNSESLVS